jgi:sterol desaturase/sphingolipid hydroxylase (fatty acid hydroxylase superfamily)
MSYWDLFLQQLQNYAAYTWTELTNPHLGNYIYWLVFISIATYALEIMHPWRKNQSKVRRDFWLDTFYMFFNFTLFPLLGFIAVATVTSTIVRDSFTALGIDTLAVINVGNLPGWLQLLTLFLLRDFVQFNIHRLLHRVPLLWEFHKVHHSVREMGFAAHLRYHWMENVVYRSLEFIPLALIGYSIDQFIVVHLIALTIGHLNHANSRIPLGPFKYIINNAPMHIWHHAAVLPPEHKHGVNFGISLSIWDYLFKTAYIPYDGRDIDLGFDNLDQFPESLGKQLVYPLGQGK